MWAYQCFQHCRDELEPGVSYSYPSRYNHLETVIYKFCEPQWEGQEKREYNQINQSDQSIEFLKSKIWHLRLGDNMRCLDFVCSGFTKTFKC